ncbi:MAG: hypothetical protein WAV92_00265 [Halopseudomonas yangmingensis]|uniref:PEGA domain-containing protein n=1 Tax=Halopseudomonas yangmingensis TaxID=1720063 RepID=A0A1I4R7I5_9GAMM|nr:hypothetical protein [Halopseudomonas yangmingensis]SFM47863.1 hypothetical protein SAMN05216217_10621 [Halopseudomonas yangmingensis]
MKINRSIALSVMLAASTALVTGCASIISDSQYPVAMTSAPAGAYFEVRNETGVVIHQGTTPSTVTLKAGDGFFSGANYSVTFKKDGYADQVNAIQPSIDGWYVANILFGGLIGLLIVDPATGAMYKLPEGSTASLSPLKVQIGQHELNVVSLDALSAEQKLAMVPLAR